MTLHPDLAALRARYDELYAAAAGGHISPDDARTTLESLSVVDGTGASWNIDIYGAYQRADFAGAPAAPADPSTYVGPESVVSNPETGQYNIGTHPTPAPAAAAPFDTAPGFGTAAPVGGGFGDPVSRPTHEFGSSATGGFGDDPHPAGGPLAGFTGFHADGADTSAAAQLDTPTRPVGDRPARSLKDAEARTGRRTPNLDPAALIALVRKNALLVGIAVVAAIIVIPTLLGGRGGDTIPTDPDTTTTPTVGDPAVGNPTGKAAKRPTGDDVSRVLNALTSGDRTYITQVVTGTPAAAQVAEAAAFYAGTKKAGVSIETGAFAPATAGQRTTTQVWQVRDGATTVFTIPVTWKRDAHTWKLAAVPVPVT